MVQAGVLTPALETTLQSLAPDEEIAVLVTLSDQVDLRPFREPHKRRRRAQIIRALRERATRTQQPLRALLHHRGAKRLRDLWLINGMAFTARADTIRALTTHPLISQIQLDVTIPLSQVVYGTATTAEWNLNSIRAPELWALGYLGQGIVVANMDTGVDSLHLDLGGRWRGGSNSWYDPNGEHPLPYDADGHGTQTMGLMVGGNASGAAIGVAPNAQWIAVKIFNDAGEAPLSAIHLGFQWLLDPDGNPDTDDAPDVVNNSWGFEQNAGQCIEAFRADIQTLKAAGIAVVFGAGNSSLLSVSPANNPEAFAVGATDALSTIAAFSGTGPSDCDGGLFPDVVAPAVLVKTTELTLGGLFPNAYTIVEGTSFAAPQVAGAMALLKSAIPDVTVSELEAVLMQTALDLGALGPDNVYGYGLIDVMEAYGLLAQNEAAGLLLFSDTFTRPDSATVDNAWSELEAGGASVGLDAGSLHFRETSDTVNRPMVTHAFTPVTSGRLVGEFDFDWSRIGSEKVYRLFMQVGDGALMHPDDPDAGVGVNLMWSQINGIHEQLGYRQGGSINPLTELRGLARVRVEVELSQGTYTVAVDGTIVGSGIALDQVVSLDTVRFFTDALNGANFAGRTFDRVQFSHFTGLPVNAAPIVTIATPADETIVSVGTEITFSATATDAEDGDLSATLEWLSDRDGAIGRGASFGTATLTEGMHVITAAVRDSAGLTGSASIQVQVDAAPSGPRVVRFTLVNADTDTDIGVLNDGALVDLAALCGGCHVNVRASTSPATVGSVHLVLTGTTHRTRTENKAPYMLAGDQAGDISPMTFNAGGHALTATAYKGPRATGDAGIPLNMSFTVK